MANYKVAYGKRENISQAIEKEIIPPGCIIITEDSEEIFFYDLNRRLKTYEQKYKFESLEEANDWLKDHECPGQIFSVHEVNKCNLYVVNYENKLEKVETSTPCVEHIQELPASEWEIFHNLNSYPTVTTVDTLCNLIMGEIIYVDTNSLLVRFSEPISGKAYIK